MNDKVMKLASTLARTHYARDTQFLEICCQVADVIAHYEQRVDEIEQRVEEFDRAQFLALAIAGRFNEVQTR